MRLLIILAFTLSCLPARCEIQTLYRGECLTPDEGAAKLATFASTYETADEWQSRAAGIRRNVRRGLKLDSLPAPCELKPIRHSTRKGDGYTVENIAFESLPGYWVTGNLYLPEHVDGKAPGVLCPHGHLADNRLLAQTQIRSAMLARMGCVVLAYDMIGYGESTQLPHRHSEAARLQTYSSMRCVDFLLSLDDVDDQRLAVTGESGGGTQSFLLACVDNRIDASIPVVMISAHFFGGCICESGMPIHKSAEHETNNVEIAASFAPKPQLVISDGDDWTSHTPRIEFPYLQRVYRLVGAEESVANAHFADEGHDYGPSKRKAMYAFLSKHFRLDLHRLQNGNGEIDEGVITLRPRDELLVFDQEHPRPKHALQDGDQIIAQLDR